MTPRFCSAHKSILATLLERPKLTVKELREATRIRSDGNLRKALHALLGQSRIFRTDRRPDRYSLTDAGETWLVDLISGIKRCAMCGGEFLRRMMRSRGTYCVRCVRVVRSRRRGPTAEQRLALNRINRESYRAGRQAFWKARSQAKRIGRAWFISRDQHAAPMRRPCTYCRLSLPDFRAGGGLDRLDNGRGYVPGNVVPCCGLCNYIRGSFFTPSEMRCVIGPAVRRVLATRGITVAVARPMNGPPPPQHGKEPASPARNAVTGR